MQTSFLQLFPLLFFSQVLCQPILFRPGIGTVGVRHLISRFLRFSCQVPAANHHSRYTPDICSIPEAGEYWR